LFLPLRNFVSSVSNPVIIVNKNDLALFRNETNPASVTNPSATVVQVPKVVANNYQQPLKIVATQPLLQSVSNSTPDIAIKPNTQVRSARSITFSEGYTTAPSTDSRTIDSDSSQQHTVQQIRHIPVASTNTSALSRRQQAPVEKQIEKAKKQKVNTVKKAVQRSSSVNDVSTNSLSVNIISRGKKSPKVLDCVSGLMTIAPKIASERENLLK
jgi:hypothetical protein